MKVAMISIAQCARISGPKAANAEVNQRHHQHPGGERKKSPDEVTPLGSKDEITSENARTNRFSSKRRRDDLR